jgi:hypothetical protein
MESGLKLEKARKGEQGGVTENSAPGLRAGSIEAYKFMLSQRDKASEQREKLVQLQEDIKQNLNEQLNELKSQAKFTKVR